MRSANGEDEQHQDSIDLIRIPTHSHSCFFRKLALGQNHAGVMAHFARECMAQMQELVQKLEVKLEADTADLAIRVRMHSDPFTAGVLRCDRDRFQLFGETMNNATRMHTTGHRDKIHRSAETAELLSDAKRDSWVKPRENIIVAKGKGALQIFW
jgi:class 3 adenylate cyclase